MWEPEFIGIFGGQRVSSLIVIQESPLRPWNLVLEFSLTLDLLGDLRQDLFSLSMFPDL